MDLAHALPPSLGQPLYVGPRTAQAGHVERFAAWGRNVLGLRVSWP